jgi:hypothetical protein
MESEFRQFYHHLFRKHGADALNKFKGEFLLRQLPGLHSAVDP